MPRPAPPEGGTPLTPPPGDRADTKAPGGRPVQGEHTEPDHPGALLYVCAGDSPGPPTCPA
jgi:hypothetical protein